MANITKDERRVNKAQVQYDQGLDLYQEMIDNITKDIPEICDILHGVAMGRTEAKYQVEDRQLKMLEKQLNVWKDNVKNPDKILAHINDELKKKFGSQKSPEQDNGSNKPKIAVFSPRAVD